MTPLVLVVNGDSNTWGSELVDRERSTWGAVIGERLGVPVVNLAVPGGSNPRLVRTTVEFLPEVCNHRGIPADRVVFVGMWTLPNRREHWGSKPHGWTLSGEHFGDGHWQHIGPWGVRHGRDPAVAWYRDLHQAWTDVEEFLCSTILLEHWLAKFGCQFTLVTAYDIVTTENLEASPAHIAQMDDDHYLGGAQGLATDSFDRLVRHLDDRGPNGHKLATSHRHYAEQHLLPHIKRHLLSEAS